MTHTPGPWQWYETDIGYSVGKDASEICDIVADYQSDEMKANAMLIAAAPQMLRVLEAIAATSDYWTEHDADLFHRDDIMDAIATAKGECE